MASAEMKILEADWEHQPMMAADIIIPIRPLGRQKGTSVNKQFKGLIPCFSLYFSLLTHAQSVRPITAEWATREGVLKPHDTNPNVMERC